jgi:hypothetical protein
MFSGFTGQATVFRLLLRSCQLSVFDNAHARSQQNATRPQPPGDHGMTFDGLRREVGDRWEIIRITGGYRAVIRDAAGHTPIPRYGRTPGELAESIRMTERQP